jgi:hypothetical protein
MVDHLPDDLLADVLARLAPRGLAASRGVCRSWRAVVDAHRLLRADLLPRSLAGILLEVDYRRQVLFSRPSTGPATCAGLVAFLGADGTSRLNTYMCGHCNGLVLLEEVVINPATGQWARLPRPPPPPGLPEPAEIYCDISLAFDPAVSPYYEVFSVPIDPYSLLKLSERPPSPLIMPVFSSRTGKWEERTFVPEGHGGHPHPMDPSYDHYGRRYYSTFCRGRLYVHCEKGFVMR